MTDLITTLPGDLRSAQSRAGRALSGLSGAQFSAVAGIGTATLNRFEASAYGASPAFASTRRKIADAFSALGVEPVEDGTGRYGVLVDPDKLKNRESGKMENVSVLTTGSVIACTALAMAFGIWVGYEYRKNDEMAENLQRSGTGSETVRPVALSVPSANTMHTPLFLDPPRQTRVSSSPEPDYCAVLTERAVAALHVAWEAKDLRSKSDLESIGFRQIIAAADDGGCHLGAIKAKAHAALPQDLVVRQLVAWEQRIGKERAGQSSGIPEGSVGASGGGSSNLP